MGGAAGAGNTLLTELFQNGLNMGKGLLFKVDITLEEKGLNEDEFNALITLIHEYKMSVQSWKALLFGLLIEAQYQLLAVPCKEGKSLQYCLLLQKASASHLEYF